MKALFALCAACLAAGLPPAMSQEAQPPGPDSFRPKETQVWLIMRFGQVSGAALHSIPMADMDQCEMAGAEFTASKRLYPAGDYRGYECLEGIR